MKIYNTMTRTKETFVPREPGRVAMYVCGPTVYNYIHIGNARTFLSFDVIRRYLTWRGFQVTFIQNITDVDDKIIRRAAEEAREPSQVADDYTRAFIDEMRALGVADPTIRPFATAMIPAMIDMIRRLIDTDHAYVAGDRDDSADTDGSAPDSPAAPAGDVYFSVRSFPDYGKLSGRNVDELRHGARIAVDERKRDPLDFALWKAAKPGEPAWNSPWGPGRPGWHIECSAMSADELGLPFDIHGGGVDLIFPHHENEIAQSEAATGTRMANYWLHGGMLQTGGEKMSKSLGNFLLLHDVLERYEPAVIRLLMLQTHYRSPIEFSDERLQETRSTLDRIRGFLDRARRTQTIGRGSTSRTDDLSAAVTAARDKFVTEMDDDFNAAGALAALFELIRYGNRYLDALQTAGDTGDTADAGDDGATATDASAAAPATDAPDTALQSVTDTLVELLDVLGIDPTPPADTAADAPDAQAQQLLEQRSAARAAKDWARADAIRDDLDARGYTIEDTAAGPRLVRKQPA
ncbi:MAG: cysteine--tRNA ligase [Actinomycetes bacterium]|jgi:cysteinyl-tRNA synthetase|nr:cysteine--tRNA ligase [Actinomycetes bacterium]